MISMVCFPLLRSTFLFLTPVIDPIFKNMPRGAQELEKTPCLLETPKKICETSHQRSPTPPQNKTKMPKWSQKRSPRTPPAHKRQKKKTAGRPFTPVGVFETPVTSTLKTCHSRAVDVWRLGEIFGGFSAPFWMGYAPALLIAPQYPLVYVPYDLMFLWGDCPKHWKKCFTSSEKCR